MEFSIVIGGEAGQGAFSVELELTDLLSRLGYYFFATKNYMSRVRGGHNFHMVRIADHPVHALKGGTWDMVAALDGETEKRHRPLLREQGIYLTQAMTAELARDARENFHDVTASNAMLVGVILSVIGAGLDGPGGLKAVAGAEQLPHLARGFEYASQWKINSAYPVDAKAGCHCIFDGNKALPWELSWGDASSWRAIP